MTEHLQPLDDAIPDDVYFHRLLIHRTTPWGEIQRVSLWRATDGHKSTTLFTSPRAAIDQWIALSAALYWDTLDTDDL